MGLRDALDGRRQLRSGGGRSRSERRTVPLGTRGSVKDGKVTITRRNERPCSARGD